MFTNSALYTFFRLFRVIIVYYVVAIHVWYRIARYFHGPKILRIVSFLSFTDNNYVDELTSDGGYLRRLSLAWRNFGG